MLAPDTPLIQPPNFKLVLAASWEILGGREGKHCSEALAQCQQDMCEGVPRTPLQHPLAHLLPSGLCVYVGGGAGGGKWSSFEGAQNLGLKGALEDG